MPVSPPSPDTGFVLQDSPSVVHCHHPEVFLSVHTPGQGLGDSCPRCKELESSWVGGSAEKEVQTENVQGECQHRIQNVT